MNFSNEFLQPSRSRGFAKLQMKGIGLMKQQRLGAFLQRWVSSWMSQGMSVLQSLKLQVVRRCKENESLNWYSVRPPSSKLVYKPQ